jgi:predicted porin
MQVLQSYWFVKSDQLGKISLGKQSQASDNTAILVDGSGSLVPANWVAFDVNSFGVRRSDGSLSGIGWGGTQSCFGMGGAWGDCNGLTQNVVRYDSPTFGGFSLSASWGEDDMWDIAGRYAGEHHGFKLAVAAAYNEVNDQNYNNIAVGLGGNVPDMDYFQLGVYVQHVASGLFGLFNYGDLDVDGANTNAETFYFKAGLRTKWNHLGATVFYGEYLNGQDGGNGNVWDVQTVAVPGFFNDRTYTTTTANSELEVFGLGVVQEIDAAAMSVWVKYRHMSYDFDNVTTCATGFLGNCAIPGPGVPGAEDFDYVGIGGLINF